MKLSVKAMAITSAVLWGGMIFVVGAADVIWPPYGRAFLEMVSSVYPGYHAGTGAPSVLFGTLYGLVDGAIGGAIFAWIYNAIVGEA
jgi:hypothetical protein